LAFAPALETESLAGKDKPPDDPKHNPIPFTAPTRRTLELSLREALALGHNYVGTEHILLGLVRNEGSAGAQILAQLGADVEKIRNEVIRILTEPSSRRRELSPAQKIDALADELREAQNANARWESENAKLRAAAKVLVAELSDAWWLRAAEAYNTLRELVDE
jgi:ATP-dependent Clp protease ATP-binding subunit ClpA